MKRKSETGNKPAFVKRKTELVFDPSKRAEFLSGFHKRKLHRKKVAQNEFGRKLKEETKRIRTEAKDNMKKLFHSYKPLVGLTEQDREEEQEYDTENVTVKVVELSTTDLAKENNWIGENRAVIRGDEVDEDQSARSSSEDEEDTVGTIPGMELDGEQSNRNKKTLKNHTEQNDGSDDETAQEKPKTRGPVLNLEGIRSKKELNRKLKRHALKSRQKNKTFQQSVRTQQQKQLKKSRRVRHFKEKHLKKTGKFQADDGHKGKKRGRRGD